MYTIRGIALNDCGARAKLVCLLQCMRVKLSRYKLNEISIRMPSRKADVAMSDDLVDLQQNYGTSNIFRKTFDASIHSIKRRRHDELLKNCYGLLHVSPIQIQFTNQQRTSAIKQKTENPYIIRFRFFLMNRETRHR